MEGTSVEQARPAKNWHFYLIGGLSILLTVTFVAAAVYYRDEVQNIQAYGYVGVFVIGVLCGISIFPAPTLLLVFTLGGVLNPVYVGLTAGLGAGIGGITVYLTGAGVETIASRFRPRGQTTDHPPDGHRHRINLSQPGFWTRGEVFYNRLSKWIGGKGGSWVLFIISAMIISPFYFAGLAAGTLRMGMIRFFLITWAGKTVRYMMVSFAGYLGVNALLKWIGE